jgi:hypothetical protein
LYWFDTSGEVFDMIKQFPILQTSLLGLLAAATFTAAPVAGQQIVRVPAEQAGSLAKGAERGKAINRLRLDDGTAEEVLTLTDAERTKSLQAVFVNRFTPTANQLPFTVENVSIAVRETCAAGDTGLRKSMTFELVVYLDPTGSGDPANADLVARQTFNLRPDDQKLQKVALEAPVTVTAGDVWIGYTNSFTSTDDRVIFHAALDTTNPKGRSWIFYNLASNFDGDVLEAAQVRHTIDEEGIPGNWLIRARGSVGS